MKKLRTELPDVTTGFISIKPSPGRIRHLDRIRTSNRLIEQYTTEHNRIKYIDVFTPMIDKTGAIRQELFDRDDDVHMNETGYQLWRAIIAVHLNNSEVQTKSGARQASKDHPTRKRDIAHGRNVSLWPE